MVFCALATAARAGWLFAFSWNADIQLWAWPALPGEELKAGGVGVLVLAVAEMCQAGIAFTS